MILGLYWQCVVCHEDFIVSAEQNQNRVGEGMSKQKLAELIIHKMQQKKEQQERNRPHFEVIQLMVEFEIEQYHALTLQIAKLKQKLAKQEEFLLKIDNQCKQLENTGKKNYPRIIISPNFFASQSIPVLTKQFYRKSANTFLREDLLKHKRYDEDCWEFQEIQEKYAKLKELENELEQKNRIDVRLRNEKRVRNLKEELRLRGLSQEILDLNKEILEQEDKNRGLVDEYELKKINLEKRVRWSEKLKRMIKEQKEMIERVYNPVSYRQYLKSVFGVRMKNESMHKSLLQILKEVTKAEQKTKKNERFLEKNDCLVVMGKCTQFSSNKKRRHRTMQTSHSPTPTHSRNQLHSSIFKNKTTSHKNKPQKTLPNSLGKTTICSTMNIQDSSLKKRCQSTFTELKNKKIKRLPF